MTLRVLLTRLAGKLAWCLAMVTFRIKRPMRTYRFVGNDAEFDIDNMEFAGWYWGCLNVTWTLLEFAEHRGINIYAEYE